MTRHFLPSVLLAFLGWSGPTWCQVFVQLRKLDPSVPTTLGAPQVEVGSHVYVTLRDDVELLRNIVISTQDANITADQLSNSYSWRTRKTGWLVQSIPVTIRTTNTEEDIDRLTGRFYITTKSQAEDTSFSVFDAVGNETLPLSVSSEGTAVIMNLFSNRTSSFTPLFNCVLSNFQMSNLSSMAMYSGVPPAESSLNSTANRFFANPVVHENHNHFADHVEDMQISFEAFYIKFTHYLSLQVEQTYFDDEVVNTTGASVTGLVMNQNAARKHTIYLNNDHSGASEAGYILSDAVLKSSLNVSLIASYDDSGNSIKTFHGTVAEEAVWVDFPVEKIILSPDYSSGPFVLQYFSFVQSPTTTTTGTSTTMMTTTLPGNSSVPTPSSTTTTTEVPTTTRAAVNLQILVPSILQLTLATYLSL